jgi:resuscitation-promoting factor RpfB
MRKEQTSRLPILIALLFLVGLLSLGAAVYLMAQEPPSAGASEELIALPQTSEPSLAAPTITATAPATMAPHPIIIIIADGENQQVLETTAATVAEVLGEIGISLETADTIDPPPATSLEQDMVIHITRAMPLAIQVDGQTSNIMTVNNSPLAVLAEAGIELGAEDTIVPAAETILKAGDTIQVKRVTAEFGFEDEAIPFQTVYQPTAELDLDTKGVLSNGIPGIMRRRFRIVYQDGVQVEEVLEEEWVEQEPVNQVIGYGTRIITATIDTPEGPREYWRVVHMRVTAYTAASSGKTPDHPNYGITASGRPAGTGIVAVDPNVIPFRSEVFVPGYGIGFAGDTGGGVKGRWIDLGYDEDELQTWNGYVDVYYLTPIPAEINYLLPEVLP